MARTVDLRVGGQNYRVVSSASADELQRLAGMVNKKLQEMAPSSKAAGAQALLLVAMAFAHELESERALRHSVRSRTQDVLRGLLGRIDVALPPDDGASDASPSLESDDAGEPGQSFT